jgi:Type I restriction modification DNA specificity domain
MKVIELQKLFKVSYGNSYDLKTLERCDKKSKLKVNYVSRTRDNNGISAIVKKISNKAPFKAGLITVAGSGNSVLESFIQYEDFYTGYHVFILEPLKPMSDVDKLFYCFCIRKNQYKYNFGRQANKTLKSLLVPIEIPDNFKSISLSDFPPPKSECAKSKKMTLDTSTWKYKRIIDLFKITSSKDDLISKYKIMGTTPYISSSEFNNGITMTVDAEGTNTKNTITANRGGSVGKFFYQDNDYLATPVDVRILIPKFKLNKYIGLFLTTVLEKEKFKYNYSRKMGTDRLKKMKIKLPIAINGDPDWKFMENYIKKLPYSSNI